MKTRKHQLPDGWRLLRNNEVIASKDRYNYDPLCWREGHYGIEISEYGHARIGITVSRARKEAMNANGSDQLMVIRAIKRRSEKPAPAKAKRAGKPVKALKIWRDAARAVLGAIGIRA